MWELCQNFESVRPPLPVLRYVTKKGYFPYPKQAKNRWSDLWGYLTGIVKISKLYDEGKGLYRLKFNYLLWKNLKRRDTKNHKRRDAKYNFRLFIMKKKLFCGGYLRTTPVPRGVGRKSSRASTRKDRFSHIKLKWRLAPSQYLSHGRLEIDLILDIKCSQTFWTTWDPGHFRFGC